MSNMDHIRNFSIIAHIDHGKSTLADRLLEVTNTVEKRKMQEQVLDSMELERERGITIKMQPVRMDYTQNGQNYILNLIDTPGHIDFSYEVSRALKAVEGVLLLVDATQGVQAQTLSVLAMARDAGLKIIPVLNKIDLPVAQVEEVSAEIIALLDCDPDEILKVSGKTGVGVPELLTEIVEKIPPPKSEFNKTDSLRALVFDFEYSIHRGVIVYVRVTDGSVKVGDELSFASSKEKFKVAEVGIFAPVKTIKKELVAGEIGYVVTAVKKPGEARVGDTLSLARDPLPAIPGYRSPVPVVWASVYPEDADDFDTLKHALERLRLTDASLSFEEESSLSLGRGFRCGFLGMLHLEIISERLRREFDLDLIVTSPTISYVVIDEKGKEETIYSPGLFPEDTKGKTILETWVKATIIMPPEYLNNVMQLLFEHEVVILETENFSGNRTALHIEMPLRELMRNFFDNLKSASSGFASFSYTLGDRRPADVVRLDVLVNDEIVAAFTRIVSRRRVEQEAEATAERLKNLIPKQLIIIKIQTKAMGRVIASRSISAMRKDVTGYLYGGDITRKMKLREKQKKGKKKMQARGRVDIPHDVFMKMMKNKD